MYYAAEKRGPQRLNNNGTMGQDPIYGREKKIQIKVGSSIFKVSINKVIKISFVYSIQKFFIPCKEINLLYAVQFIINKKIEFCT